jgi:uracil-DNA glycosylase family 4
MVMKTKKLNWVGHKARWQNCTLCHLCETRKRVVLGKGKIPAEVLFLGEAPGMSEDANDQGKPFVGPAGREFDKMILESLAPYEEEFGLGPVPTMFFSNVVGCWPKKEPHYTPTKKSIKACAPRVLEVISLVKPRLIVAVGKIAEKQAEVQEWSTRCESLIAVTHPSAIISADESMKALLYKRTLVQLNEAMGMFYG